jgi:GMP synthase-like glutamine amidotransferase
MRIHSILHVDFEGLGYIEDWVKEKNFPATLTRQYLNDPLPGPDSFDTLIVMGGPMNIYEDNKYPWLVKEKEFIDSAIKNNKKVLGICLGAQLIAHCLGSKIYKNSEKEIGWFPIRKIFSDHDFFPQFNNKNELVVFHWHGETYDLPGGTERLFESDGCRNQGFSYNDRIIGLQFHLEMKDNSLKNIIKNCKNEIQQGKYIQSEEEIMNNLVLYHPENIKMLRDLFNAFLL